MPSKTNKPIVISSTEPPSPFITEKIISDAMITAVDNLYRRMRGVETYTSRLNEADIKVGGMVEQINKEIHSTYKIMTAIYLVSYIIGFLTLATGFYIIFFINNPNFYTIGFLCIAGGLLSEILLLMRNPIKNSHYLVTNSAKLGFAYSSYMRQMHQVDIAFKQLLGTGEDIDSEKLERMFKMTQDSVDEMLATISQMLNEMDE